MHDATLKNLKQAAQDLAAGHNSEEKLALLGKAFELFSQETSRLETAYSAMKEQFMALNLELEQSNRQLKAKVVELDAVSHYLNSILSNLSQGIVFIDLNGLVTTYNRTAEAILGVEMENALFNQFWENFPDDMFGFSLREVLSTGKSPQTSLATYLRHDGVSKELETTTTFVINNNEDAQDAVHSPILELTQGLIILIRDVTDLRRLQTLANRNDRLKELGEMAAMVAHEIRNPLGGIKGFASLLKRDLADRPDQQQMAGYIVEGTDNLNRLVTNVLNYSRPVQAEFETVNLVSLVQDVLQHVAVDNSLDNKIRIATNTEEKTLLAPADPQLIKSALLNLIVNAIQAMPGGGDLTVGIKREEGKAVLTILDTGVGISKENLEKIFSPFFTTKPDGNGFGLAEVYKVIQAHGGTIEVDSTVGKGTTFTIKIPLKT